MYARQCIFEYHDKPESQLARILAEPSEVGPYVLKNDKGENVFSTHTQRKNSNCFCLLL